jgi:predicted DNA-binding protein (MmcQ/YjbR family)
MTGEELSAYCLAKPGAWADQPWEADTVAKADEWLARYPDDASALAYIGRSGWNRLGIGGGIPDDEIRDAVDTSYELVVSKLPKKHRPSQ